VKPLGPDDVVSVAASVASSRLGEEAALLNLEKGVYYGLNETGARIWELLATPVAVRSIQETIATEYDVEAPVAAADVLRLLESLREQGLVEVRDGDT
jgi:hypothetical protein